MRKVNSKGLVTAIYYIYYYIHKVYQKFPKIPISERGHIYS